MTWRALRTWPYLQDPNAAAGAEDATAVLSMEFDGNFSAGLYGFRL
jgi:hypothetical protein